MEKEVESSKPQVKPKPLKTDSGKELTQEEKEAKAKAAKLLRKGKPNA